MNSRQLAKPFAIAGLALLALGACNSSDYKDEDSSTKDSSVSTSTQANPSMGAADQMKEDHTATAATPAPAKKRGKLSVKMPENATTATMATVQTMPEFPGGQNGLDNYVNNHIDYPQTAIDDNISGTVRVSFVVDENGKVTKAHVVGNKLGNGLDEQAIKVVSNMPDWKPGKVKGKNVKTRLELPIAFQVEA
ncbi:MAG: energy transducer TonB [Bacteroidetes bacterium]|nr:energy transducer TonB [Bacteroidota bacterium]